jgi:ribosome biogenesis protein YTM1
MTTDIERELNTPTIEDNLDPSQAPTQFEIRFFTTLSDEYRVPDDKIIVPGSVNRLELSDLVNDMIVLEKRIPYDFLINGEFLRGELTEHCGDRGILSEKTIDIEYVIAMSEPDTVDLNEPEKDWISRVASHGDIYFTCSLSGSVSMYELGTGKLIKSVIQSTLPLTGLFCTNNGVLVSTGKDGRVRFANAQTLETFETSVSVSPIQCLSVCPFDNSLALTGSTSGELYLWNIPLQPQVSAQSSKKRSSIPEVDPRAEMDSTTVSGVSGIEWMSLTRVIVSSLDGTIQVIDPLSKSCLPTINTNRSISALALLNSKTLATGHADGRVIFWQIKSDEVYATLEATNSCRSHSRMITDIKSMPGSETLIASASVDGHIKLFDSRATSYAVQSVSLPKNERALCLCWVNPEQIISGASDGVTRSHKVGRMH